MPIRKYVTIIFLFSINNAVPNIKNNTPSATDSKTSADWVTVYFDGR